MSLVMITVTHNSAEYLDELVRSVRRSSLKPDLWIFVDSGSTDVTPRILKEIAKDGSLNIKVILEKNLGYSACVEKGVSEIRKEKSLLLVCNADGFFDERAIELLVSCYLEDPESIVQPMIVRPDGSIDSAGNMFSLTGLACPRSSLQGYQSFFYISGACFLTSLKVYRSVRGMDPNIFMGADDLDLSWRAMLKGFNLRICRDAVYFHHGRSGEAPSPRRMGWRVRSILWTMIKCLPARFLPIVIISSILHLGVAFMLSIMRKNPLYTFRTVKSMLDLVTRTDILFKERAKIRSEIRVKDQTILVKMSPSGVVIREALRRYLQS